MFSIPDFVPGVSYSLTVSGTDGDEQTDTEVVEFEIAPLPGIILCASCSWTLCTNVYTGSAHPTNQTNSELYMLYNHPLVFTC